MRPRIGKTKFSEKRFTPSKDVGYFVEYFWHVEWDLTGKEPYVTETLPHPSVHIVFENDSSYVLGIMKTKFSRTLEEKGSVFGIKFHPGGFYPFLGKSVSTLTNEQRSLTEIFGREGTALHRQIFSSVSPAEKAASAEKFLGKHLPRQDETIGIIGAVVEKIISDRRILKVDDLVEHFQISKRTLQRIFSDYVGINPKWMIKRYRLHEAVELLENSRENDLLQIALGLGYFDQAHFIKDFKTIVGKSPAKYLAEFQSRRK
ncbi:MAG: helix-turn-helix domain-containing protein [Bacteroidota bacterium]